MFNWLKAVFQGLALVATVVGVIERPGEGDNKKKEAIDIIRERLPELVPMPQWIRDLFLDSKFLPWLVDTVVWAANRFGFFNSSHSGEESTSSD